MSIAWTPFYHQLLRKYHVAFGSLFNNITLLRLDSSNAESSRFVIPIEYSAQEPWLARLRRDPDLTRKDEMTVPRLAYEMTGLRSEPTRQLNSLNQRLRPVRLGPNTVAQRYFVGAPHTLTFNLYALTRSIEDANQITEQIVPVFAATGYNMLLQLLPSVGLLDRMRVVLDDNSPTIEDNYQDTAFQSKREITLTFTFSVFANLYGVVPTIPVDIIRKVVVDFYNVPSDYAMTEPSYYITDALDRLLLESGAGYLLDESVVSSLQDVARLERLMVTPNPLDAPPVKPVDTTTTIIHYEDGTVTNPFTGSSEIVGT